MKCFFSGWRKKGILTKDGQFNSQRFSWILCSRCHFGLPAVLLYNLKRCQCLERGCIHVVFWCSVCLKIVLWWPNCVLFRAKCQKKVHSLGLHFLTLSRPITLGHLSITFPNLVGASTLTMVAYTFLRSGSLIVIILSMTGVGYCSSCWAMEFLIAKPTPDFLRSFSPCHSKRTFSSEAFSNISVSVVHTCWDFSCSRTVLFGTFFLWGDVEDASETAQVESVKLPLLSWVRSPGIAAVQQCDQNTFSVDQDLGIFRQLLVGPYPLIQAGNGGSGLADASV